MQVQGALIGNHALACGPGPGTIWRGALSPFRFITAGRIQVHATARRQPHNGAQVVRVRNAATFLGAAVGQNCATINGRGAI